MAATPEVTSMALFCDFENIALGVSDAKYDKFDIKKVLERLLLKGSIVVKKAYCDWERYKPFKRSMHEASFELIEIPHVRQAGKNSADIRLVVDALDLCYTKAHVDTFVIISGDSDFSPLVSKLRENDKTVIGVGVKNSTSDLLIANCDEFIFYDDLVREEKRRAPAGRATGRTRTAVAAPAAGTGGEEKVPDAPAAPSRRRGSRSAAKDALAPAAAKVAATTEDPGAAAKSRSSKPRKSASRTASARGRKAAPGEPTAAEIAALEAAAGGAGHPAANGEGWVAEPSAVPAVGPDHPLAGLEEPVAADAPTDVDRPGGGQTENARQSKAIDKVISTVEALVAERGDVDALWGSMVKQTLKRREPGFNEAYFGFRSFNALLEDAQRRGLITLERDEKSGGYKVRLATTEV